MIEERVLRKWFELSSVIPVAAYLVIHLVSYLRVLWGSKSFGAGDATGIELVLEALLVWLPLAFHVGYGAWLTSQPLANQGEERRRTLLLRITGAIALAFLLYHAYWLRWPMLRGERNGNDTANALAAGLSALQWGVPIAAIAHLLGLAAVSAHLSAGLSRFFERWQLASAARAQLAARALSIALFALSSAAVVELATGSAMPNFVR